MSRFFKFIGWSLFAGMSGGIFLLSAFFLYLTPNLPEVEQLKDIQLQIPLRIYSSDNKLIAEFGEKRRNPISIEKVPPTFINAFVAAEDNRFFSHPGVDLKGLMRAVFQLVTTGHIQSGGSTITMQVAKNFFLSREKTFTRKFNEILLALQIEQDLSKKEIIELYFNKIYLGNRSYGIEAASQVYYGKHMDELTLPQMAMIAGLPKAPSRYNPLANPQRALTRRNWILRRLYELNYIEKNEYETAKNAPITASYHGAIVEVSAPYLAEMARRKVIRLYGQKAYTEGLKVFLTVDSKLQIAAQNAIHRGVENYDTRHGYRGPEQKVDLNRLNTDINLNDFLAQIPTYHDLRPAVVKEVEDEKAIVHLFPEGDVTLSLKNALWAKPYISVNQKGKTPSSLKDILAPGNLIRIRKKGKDILLKQLPAVESTLVSINPQTGALIAIVGGYDFGKSKYNRALLAKRQPGSNIKPFIYLAALNDGFTAATTINDAPIVFDDAKLETAWRPENSGGKFAGPTRLRKALYTSRNLVSIRILKAIGIQKTLNYLRKFGFNPDELPHNLSLALGSAGITPINIARGYSIIANGGYPISPYFIDKIIDADGDTIFESTPPILCEKHCNTKLDEISTLPSQSKPKLLEPVTDPREIYIMHSILKDVIRKGTGRRARVLKRTDLAGKTGTTNEQKDAWFSGFNQRIETTVWTGFDQPETLGRREFGATAALPIWIDFMKVALQGMPPSSMKQPPGIVSVRINPETGKQTYTENKKAIFEIFRRENLPEMERKPIVNSPSNGSTSTENSSHETVIEEIF